MKPKGKKWVWRLILILIVGGFIVFAAVKCEGIIRRSVAELSVDNDANAAWIGSLASYWGGILGGIFSGIIAVIGVFYTIQFTREADRRKERQGIQPFLNVKIVSKSSGGSIKQFKIADDPKYVDGKATQEFYPIYLSITNIGNGFATTLVIHTGYNAGGLRFNYVILIGESIYIYFIADSEELKEGLCFSLQYVDSMTNEYIQEYTVKSRNDRISIDCGYPQLLE